MKEQDREAGLRAGLGLGTVLWGVGLSFSLGSKQDRSGQIWPDCKSCLQLQTQNFKPQLVKPSSQGGLLIFFWEVRPIPRKTAGRIHPAWHSGPRFPYSAEVLGAMEQFVLASIAPGFLECWGASTNTNGV